MQAILTPQLPDVPGDVRQLVLRSGPGRRLSAALAAYLTPTLGHLLFAAAIAVVLTSAPKFLSADGDASRHLTVGQHILAERAIPSVDVFSFTRGGDHFVPYEWLAELSSALSFELAGLAGVVLLHGVAVALTCALLYSHVRRRGAPVLLAAPLVTFAAVTSMLHWLARPHVFTFLGTVVFLSVLDDWHSGRSPRRLLWFLAPAMVLWVNAHGGFLIGLILLGAYAGSDAVRAMFLPAGSADPARRRLHELALPAAAIFAATVLNPAGPFLYEHVTGYFGKKLLVNRTYEYMSPDFHMRDSLPFLAMLLGLLLSLAWSRRRLALHEGLLCAGFAYFSLHSARNIPLFAFIVAPILANQLATVALPATGRRWAPLIDRLAKWVSRRNAAYGRIEALSRGHVLPVVLVGALIVIGAWQSRSGELPLGVQVDPKAQPVAAVEHVKANPPAGNMFNELRWGGYLLHQLWPSKQVFIDGQTDFYGEALTREWLDVIELQPGWQDVLYRRDISWVIVDSDTLLTRALEADPSWRVEFRDATATVLVRR